MGPLNIVVGNGGALESKCFQRILTGYIDVCIILKDRETPAEQTWHI